MGKFSILLISILTSLPAVAQIQIGQSPPLVEIGGQSGGLVNGSPWKSSSLGGKVYSLFYVDPDEKDANTELEAALKKEEFNKNQYGSVAVINLAATWKPNLIIERILASKQKEFPDTIYVRDKSRVLVSQWGLDDNAYAVLLFDKTGKLLFSKAGRFAPADIKNYIAAIKANL